IVVATHSGRTAMAVSKQRSPVPILALTDRFETARRMCLYWGVTPVKTDAVHAPADALIEFVTDWGKRNHVLESGSRVILVGSTDWSRDGKDVMMVHTVE
ncbi:MAG: pyruvate kinase, partial [Planctomycetaceae bacterium]|nr:pyruvate kinase [Planctomycetaceae bacterium]